MVRLLVTFYAHPSCYISKGAKGLSLAENMLEARPDCQTEPQILGTWRQHIRTPIPSGMCWSQSLQKRAFAHTSTFLFLMWALVRKHQVSNINCCHSGSATASTALESMTLYGTSVPSLLMCADIQLRQTAVPLLRNQELRSELPLLYPHLHSQFSRPFLFPLVV